MTFQSLEQKGVTFEQLKEQQTLELPVDKIPWHDYRFQTPTGKFEFTSLLGGSLKLAVPEESKWKNPKLAEHYPYHLLTIHPLRSNHSQNYHLLPTKPKVKVEIASNIAEQKKLQNGDLVRVWNKRGEVRGFISVLAAAHPNTINIDEGIWKEFGGSVNKLTSNRKSDNGLGSTLYDCLVNIEKVN
jgi:anaerobic selenocysteine-containing dehydrogenase